MGKVQWPVCKKAEFLLSPPTPAVQIMRLMCVCIYDDSLTKCESQPCLHVSSGIVCNVGIHSKWEVVWMCVPLVAHPVPVSSAKQELFLQA